MDWVSNSDEDIEANLSTVFQSVCGYKQYWYLRHSVVLCMVREYGSPTPFLTQVVNVCCLEQITAQVVAWYREDDTMQRAF